MAASNETVHDFAAPAERVFEAIRVALRDNGMLIRGWGPSHFFASGSASLASWGEDIQIHLFAIGPDRTSVKVRSSLKMGLVDWGRNRKNVDQLFASIHQALTHGTDRPPPRLPAPSGAPQPVTAPAVPAGQWHPDPTGRHELRWWDGAAWTPSVSDGGNVTHDPL